MIALLVGMSVMAGAAIGWYTYKAGLRIAMWGRKMNEFDQLVRNMTKHEEGWQAHPNRIWIDPDTASESNLMHPHLPLHTASK
jgi:hypothetical protein